MCGSCRSICWVYPSPTDSGIRINMFIHILWFVEGGFYLLTRWNHLQTTIWKNRFFFFQASYLNPSSVFVLSFWVVVVGSLYESWLPMCVRKKIRCTQAKITSTNEPSATCLLEWHFVCLQGRFKLFWDSFTLVSESHEVLHGSYDILDEGFQAYLKDAVMQSKESILPYCRIRWIHPLKIKRLVNRYLAIQCTFVCFRKDGREHVVTRQYIPYTQ